MSRLFDLGWQSFGPEPKITAWVQNALPAAQAALSDPARADWRCGGTWFAGVGALPNDATGAIGTGPPLDGAAMDFIRGELGLHPELERGQISVIRPGYPAPSEGETPAAFAFRRDRDAAHLDGLLPVGPDRRRMLREPHAFVLGLALTDCDPTAAPLVAWEGSHTILRAALGAALAPFSLADWGNVDLTDAYHAARRRCFSECPRRILPQRPGEALLLHRLTLHGVSAWADGAVSVPEGRAIAYFRPMFRGPEALREWLLRP